MADILNIGTSALLSLQQAINTTGHNIANVNTEGYSRQRVGFETLPAQLSGGSYIGSGVMAGDVSRIYDQFLVDSVRGRLSSQSGFQTYYDLASRMDGLLADPSAGLSPVVNSFFNALQDVANNPGSLPERQVLLGEAQQLADRFHYLDANFRSMDSEINARIATSVNEINGLAQNIANLNDQIVRASASGAQPNDLLDSRDQLINDLSKLINVSTVKQSDGAVNIMIGNGQPLVVGSRAEQLQTFDDPYNGTRLQVGMAGISGTVMDLSRFLSGGELGAALDFRQQVLDPAINQLGLMAQGITDTVNAQHRLGLDLNGDLGSDFFLPLTPTVGAHTNNAGTGAVTATITDATALTASDYSLRYSGGQWTLTNLTTKAAQTGAGPFTVDGLQIAVSGTPSKGDSFVIQPTRQAASLFAVAISDPEAIAAASPLRSESLLSNIGNGDISGLSVSSAAGLPLVSSVTLTFNPDAFGPGVPGYDVSGIAGGPLAYDPAVDSGGKSFVLGSFEFTLSGQPQSGDQILIENNTDGGGDNRNALALAALQTDKLLYGGKAGFQDVYGRLVADVAVKTRQAESSASTEQVLLNQAISARDSVSGVNLDEEAADLIRFQQAYQAAAQIISVADQLFQVLLNATQR